MFSKLDRTSRSGWLTWAGILACGLLVGACASASADQPADLETSLEPGHGPDHYWTQLEQLGYQVTAVNYDDEDYVEYEIVKGDSSYEVQIDLDDDRRATDIAVVANAWEAAETAAALERVTVMVPAGTRLQVKLEQSVSSDDSEVGDTVRFSVMEPVMVGGSTAIPQGAMVVGTVIQAESAERPQKPGRLAINLEQLDVRGENVDIQAGFASKGKGSHEDDARDIGIGAALGAIVGAIAEGAEGAVAGIVLGGGGVFLATKGEDVEIPAGTPLLVELEESVSVPAGADAIAR